MLHRTREPANTKKGEPEKKPLSHDDEVEMRALILDNTSTSELTLITKLVELCKEKGFDESDVADVLRKIISERVLDTLNDRYVLRLYDSD